ncbi:unnamed protein product [Vitrella brassicaformis CCMP3155]|uniref:Protein kinase domain-containing protein n=1 Tax=Vitrella brassicaformis (strain CCMP3155) TaxID=1169540 RepID=A0A0G4G0K8_VITBC|nr:unnamed protein product [Vitrella brassicaformis CCMP3155]|eukprot:CEM21068.1 unnamed protein product [Vitrella brassicaformis CCMP3155]
MRARFRDGEIFGAGRTKTDSCSSLQRRCEQAERANRGLITEKDELATKWNGRCMLLYLEGKIVIFTGDRAALPNSVQIAWRFVVARFDIWKQINTVVELSSVDFMATHCLTSLRAEPNGLAIAAGVTKDLYNDAQHVGMVYGIDGEQDPTNYAKMRHIILQKVSQSTAATATATTTATAAAATAAAKAAMHSCRHVAPLPPRSPRFRPGLADIPRVFARGGLPDGNPYPLHFLDGDTKYVGHGGYLPPTRRLDGHQMLPFGLGTYSGARVYQAQERLSAGTGAEKVAEVREGVREAVFLKTDLYEEDAAAYTRRNLEKGRPSEMLEEEAMKEMIAPVIISLRDLFHRAFVSHGGDIKLGNFLIEGKGEGELPTMKLIDFGLSRVFQGEEELRSREARERLTFDIKRLGDMVGEMLYGVKTSPKKGPTRSSHANAFYELLTRNTATITYDDILNHAWLRRVNPHYYPGYWAPTPQPIPQPPIEPPVDSLADDPPATCPAHTGWKAWLSWLWGWLQEMWERVRPWGRRER